MRRGFGGRVLYPVAGMMVCAVLAATVAYDHTGGKVIDLPTPYVPEQVALESTVPVTAVGTVGLAFGAVACWWAGLMTSPCRRTAGICSTRN